RHIFTDICSGHFSGTNTTLKMSPNMTCEALQAFSPRLTVTKRKEALELRKTMKPLMEKRRRARINDSLNHLKNLILPLTGRDKTRYSKLEKADILEMTVRFLSDIPPVNNKNSTDSYREGYKACLQRVSALLPKTSLDQDACQRVNDFVQQSTSATITPTCLNCCAQSSRTFPQIQQRLQSLKSSFSSRLEIQSRSSGGAAAPSRAQSGPQAEISEDVNVEIIQQGSALESKTESQSIRMRCVKPRTSKAVDEVDRTAAVVEKRQASQSQRVSRDVGEGGEAGAQQGSKYQLSRIMTPNDANIVGNVHGGIILKMIEEAGCIVGTRHCNTQNGVIYFISPLWDRCVAALVRVEKTEFLSPVFIGEVAHVTAEITYTSKHSLEVQVKVMTENILTGAKKVANKAALWYVPCSLQNVDKIMEVPPIKYANAEQEEEGRKRYEAQKMERLETKARIEEAVTPPPNPEDPPKEQHTVGFSQSSLIHLVGPSDCTLNNYVHGGYSCLILPFLLSTIISFTVAAGTNFNDLHQIDSTQQLKDGVTRPVFDFVCVTMKLMDEVAGIVAARHCSTNIVTASVDAINFHRKIKKGCVVTVTGRLTFVSNKSMEIEVLVDACSLVDAERGKYRAVSAFFTFISLDKDNKPLPVPPLKIDGEEEQRRFEEGKARYLQNKAKRLADKERQQ
ncbi:hypothetical protein L3Q82_015743, partial [Scortum barcoo]